MSISTLKQFYNYNEYKHLVEDCVEKNKTTGSEQLPERIDATKLNATRIKRIDKQITLLPALIEILNKLHKKLTWVVLTEAWCGDGAQNIPVISKIAEYTPNIELKILLRDDNLSLMDKYLTNGSRSVPKLICFDAATEKELGTWGARPTKIQNMVKDYKAANPDVSHDEFVKNLHLWYAKDKGESLQDDFIQLIKSWSE